MREAQRDDARRLEAVGAAAELVGGRARSVEARDARELRDGRARREERQQGERQQDRGGARKNSF